MTPKEARFVEEYLTDLNGRQAAIRAGYSPNCAHNNAFRLKRKPEIKAAIEAGIDERSQRTQVQADQVVTELARIAFADLRDTVAWGPEGMRPRPCESLSPDAARALSEVSGSRSGDNLRVKLFDKKAALECLGRHLGIFPDRRGGLEAGLNLPPLRVIIGGEEARKEVQEEGQES